MVYSPEWYSLPRLFSIHTKPYTKGIRSKKKNPTTVAFYGVATLSQNTLSPILGFIVYITLIQRSKAASPVVSKALIVSDGYLIDHHPTKRSLFAAGAIGCPSATQQDSRRPGTAPW